MNTKKNNVLMVIELGQAIILVRILLFKRKYIYACI